MEKVEFLGSMKCIREDNQKILSFRCIPPITPIDEGLLRALKTKVFTERAQEARICLHHDHLDELQEAIVLLKKSGKGVIHKHRHCQKSFHVLSGILKLDLYDKWGEKSSSIHIGEQGGHLPFMVRVERDVWHATTPLTDVVILKESAGGPFDPNDRVLFSRPQHS